MALILKWLSIAKIVSVHLSIQRHKGEAYIQLILRWFKIIKCQSQSFVLHIYCLIFRAW